MSAALAISVVIRTRLPPGEAPAFLESLNHQWRRPDEIIVIDSGSPRGVVESLRSTAGGTCQPPDDHPLLTCAPLRLIEIPPESYQSARALNTAIAAARGDLIAILSQDATPHPAFLARLAACFEDSQIAGAYGRQCPGPIFDPLVTKDLLTTYPPRSRVQRAPDCWFVNTCSMIRRDLWERHPFQEWAVISEDHEWAKWAQSQGFAVAYCAEAEVEHAHAPRGLWRRHFQEGLGLGAIHGQAPSAGASLASYIRQVGSDAVWLTRRRRPHWIPASVWRRGVKHAALHVGMHRAVRGLSRGAA